MKDKKEYFIVKKTPTSITEKIFVITSGDIGNEKEPEVFVMDHMGAIELIYKSVLLPAPEHLVIAARLKGELPIENNFTSEELRIRLAEIKFKEDVREFELNMQFQAYQQAMNITYFKNEQISQS